MPDDVSVMGMDDLPQAAFLTPPLTTMHIPMREIGAAALDLLRDASRRPADAGAARRARLPSRRAAVGGARGRATPARTHANPSNHGASSMTKFGLGGRKALVTGANAGIGQAIAAALAGAGAHVACAGRSAMDEPIAVVKAAGGAGSACAMDLAEPLEAARRLAEADEEQGGSDILSTEPASSACRTRWTSPKPTGTT